MEEVNELGVSAGPGSRKGRSRVTVKDLARDLGMSVSTVSRAFYAEAVVAPATRELVLKRARELGYRPNPMAQSLKTNRTQIAGMVVSDITNPFYPEVMSRLAAGLHEIGMNVMLISAPQAGEIDDAVKLLLSYQPDLVIILAATLSSEAMRECRTAGSPCIFFNRLSSDPDSFGVSCDNAKGGGKAADFLIKRNHKRLAYISAYADASTNMERRDGFLKRVVERGLTRPVVIEAGSFSYEAGYEAAGAFGELEERPDGVFCANDIVALGFIDGVRNRLGLDVPGDISVVGFDDIAMAGWPSHGLTTVGQPVDEMVSATVELAATLAADPREKPIVTRLAPRAIVERTTTRRR
ncbi:LacI family DNA-binding transcriptional regulator [Aquamicrobium ahrensii]|uniref:DNA-binding LacI/PurR family transcriptional regulator n=1 Tax=Aquamicrobium ahrensii TaxID=469551 RepID=A0ABV2KPQ6_9HYPH